MHNKRAIRDRVIELYAHTVVMVTYATVPYPVMVVSPVMMMVSAMVMASPVSPPRHRGREKKTERGKGSVGVTSFERAELVDGRGTITKQSARALGAVLRNYYVRSAQKTVTRSGYRLVRPRA